MLVRTTLLSSPTPLVYGAGCSGIIANPPVPAVTAAGVPKLNALDHTNYFTGDRTASIPAEAHLPNNAASIPKHPCLEDRRHVYVSDEYGRNIRVDRTSVKGPWCLRFRQVCGQAPQRH